jgi:glycosyltransferase involved in cell wall biosynthesis
MSKHHQVHVITRANNQTNIESSVDFQNNSNITFHYYDLPKVLMFWKKGRRGYQLYYYLWQIFIYFKFRKYINNEGFDIVHHLTFGANWMPSLLMLTKPITIWGPVGSEDVYKPILKSLPLKVRGKEFVRTIVKTFFYYVEPARWLTIINADIILSHSSRFAHYKYPRFIQHKVREHIQTGINTSEPEYKNINSIKKKDKNTPTRLIIASELISWKGVVLAAEVFSTLAQNRNDIELIILGSGPEKKLMQQVFFKYGVEDVVTFKGHVSKSALMKELYDANILLYPAYHHGLATLILQSMYSYLPIISIEGDIISQVIDKKCGLAASGNDLDEIKKNLILITKQIIDDDMLRESLALKGRKMIEETFEWSKLVEQMNYIYLQQVKIKKT